MYYNWSSTAGTDTKWCTKIFMMLLVLKLGNLRRRNGLRLCMNIIARQNHQYQQIDR